MERKELLSSLYALKKKIEACDLIKKSINGYESQVSETQKKIKAETCPNKMPADVPPYGDTYPAGCSNIEAYDKAHRPKESCFIKIATVLGGAIWVAVSNLILLLALHHMEVELDASSILAYIILMAICMFITFYPVAYLLYLPAVLCQKIQNARNKSLVEKYMLKHRRERKAEYQKDLDINQAAIDKYHAGIQAMNKTVAEYQGKIKEDRARLAEACKVVQADTALPAAYKEIDIVNTIIEYLENRRADSLKEAINLYEYTHEMKVHNASVRQAAWQSAFQAERQADAMREAAEHQERLTQEAERRRRAAEKAAEANQEALDILKDWERKSN